MLSISVLVLGLVGLVTVADDPKFQFDSLSGS